MHPLCIHCVLISYVMPIKHLYSVISSAEKVLNCTKHFERMNFTPLLWQSATSTSNKRTMSVIIRWKSAVSFLPPLDLLSTHTRCLWKRREGGKIRYMDRLYIVSSTDIERCKRMHLVCLFVCLFVVFRPIRELFTHIETLHLTVKRLKNLTYARHSRPLSSEGS